jgi:tRNA A58 N-methylase Trm61
VRSALLLVVIAAALGCGSKDVEPAANGSNAAREEAQFDAERRPDLIVAALGIKPGSRVADIGAGSGLLTVHLARAVAPSGKVIATDTNKEVLGMLERRLTRAGLASVVEGRAVDPDKPGLEAGQYDAILLSEVDHFFTDPVRWLKDVEPALKPGGRIVIANRIHHRAQAMDAAQKAGLVLQSETSPVPTNYIAVFVVKGGK